ncbi:signal peptide peptidase SppA [Thermovibrio sp.]
MRKLKILFFVVGVAVLLMVAVNFILQGKLNFPGRLETPKVAIVKVEGVIRSSDRYLDLLDRLEKDKSVKAIVLRVNSPGGVVGACQEIYQKINEVKKLKPVVVSMGPIAASGGLYISVAANKIVADPGTITGSIGVIIQTYNLSKLAQKIGVEVITVKSGRFKDLLNPFKKPDPEAIKVVQHLIDDSYQQFVEAVAKGRHLPVSKVKAFADGRIFTGREAKELGLVDYLGNIDTAVKVARELSHCPKAVKFKVEDRRGFLEELFGEKEEGAFKNLLKALSGNVEEVNLMYVLN